MSEEILVLEDQNDGGQVVVDEVVEDQLHEQPDDHIITDNINGTRTLHLKHPITLKFKKTGSSDVESRVYEELTFRRITGGDLRAVGKLKNDLDIMFGLLERLCTGVPPQVFDNMDAIDVEGCQLAIEPFLPKSPETGNRF